MSFELSRESLRKFSPVKSFRLPKSETCPVTSLAFDDAGELLLATYANENIQLFDAVSCKFLTTIASKKYGCHASIFTHSQAECIYSSTSKSFDIRHLNLETNQYLRYFTGHGALVTDLVMSPTSDFFLSCSYDESVRLWDLRAPKAIAIVPAYTPNCVAYDPSGLVFALGNPSGNEIGLYNIKSLRDLPFLVIKLDRRFENQWNKLEFSNCGRYILVSGTSGKQLVLDAFDGTQLFTLQGVKPFPYREFIDSGSACFTPDGNSVLGTSYDGRIAVWDINNALSDRNLNPIVNISGVKDSSPRCIKFNPKHGMFVTADENLDFYVYS
ncbi:member of Set1p complex, histone methyl transferase [Hanseniaspora osmophila]|uniref:COMPASS component SWD2 n=1 Tax=Hanseniaspora osmophila TaxID=56408 RepID=A0A1E5RC97_9ASCO|nr:COMPASS component SWD2 [Hanseniaspora osmophila]